MTDDEIRAHIFLTLARLYEDPLRRKQYNRFTFESSDKKRAREILANLNRNQVVEQLQPDVVRLTDLGYKLIQSDLKHLRKEAPASEAIPTDSPDRLKPPSPEEIESISHKLGQPDYISASRFRGGVYEIYWATEGIQKVTGYTKEELNEAGGLLAVIQGSGTLMKLKMVAQILFKGKEVTDEVDIITKRGRKRTIRFVTRSRYDSNGKIIGSINAIKDVTNAIKDVTSE